MGQKQDIRRFWNGFVNQEWAAFMNLLPQLDALLEHKPRLDIRDRAGNTALDYAMRFRHDAAVARLKAAAGQK